jgi:hypothetical protein
MTNEEIIRRTLKTVVDSWDPKPLEFDQNEASFGLIVVEPILCALEWPPLPKKDILGSGAFFEWPAYHCIDVCLLDHGNPRVFLELKSERNQLGRVIQKAVEKFDILIDAQYGLTGWFRGTPGFQFYIPQKLNPNDTKHADCFFHSVDWIPEAIVSLSDEEHAPIKLACIAKSVLVGGIDMNYWLSRPTTLDSDLKPRFNLLSVRNRFFEQLCSAINQKEPLKPTDGPGKHGKPTATYAYVEPEGCSHGYGLALVIDPCANRLSCLFYEGSTQKRDSSTVRCRFEGSVTDECIDTFVTNYVIKAFETHRQRLERL